MFWGKLSGWLKDSGHNESEAQMYDGGNKRQNVHH